MLLEFPSLLCIFRNAITNGPNNHQRILKRAAEDKLFEDFLANQAMINSKTVLYGGSLDVCHHMNDMTESPHRWQEYLRPGDKISTEDDDDTGYSPCTNNNRKRFKRLILQGRLYDPGATSFEEDSLHTRHGDADIPTDTFRDQYLCVSRDVASAGCIKTMTTPGANTGEVGHFGSRHSPVVLRLSEGWVHRLKGTKGKVLEESTPYYKRKSQSLKTRLAPFRDREKNKQNFKTCAFIEFLKLATTLSVLERATPKMSAGAQYFTTHRDGEILLPDSLHGPIDPIKFHSLWDTGASNANYMSSQFYEKHKEALEPLSVEVDTAVTLGDKKTRLKLNRMVTVQVRFFSDTGEAHEAEIPMMVLESDGRDAIIGMPSLITDFGQLFKQMVNKAVDKYAQPDPNEVKPDPYPMVLEAVNFAGYDAGIHDFYPDDLQDFVNQTSMDGIKNPEKERPPMAPGEPLMAADLMPDMEELEPPEGCEYPWSTRHDEHCPEDDLIPEAISNDRHLEHLTRSYGDEMERFHTLLNEHIDSDFMKAKPEVKELLKKYVGCFVKEKWVGLNLPEIVIKFKDTLPARLKPYTPRIPQNLLGHSEKEFKRMLEYFYVESDSPWASPLTVAPKGTSPFIRLCVNLRKINSYVDFGHFPIPNVKGTLESLLPYKYFCDIDLTSSFHQMRLSKESSEKLSVSTPWGQYRPLFVPEGLCQASQSLQENMSIMFGEMGDWCSILFDNILIGGKDENELLTNLEKFLKQCEKYNVYLKIDKSWFGCREVKFFGYKVVDGRYYLEDSRSEAIDLIPFPPDEHSAANKQTAMRSFLGQTRIFQPHVPDYTFFSGPLEQMTSSNFNWDRTTWKEDFQLIFEQFKSRLKTAMVLFMPDFNKEWILRTDASTTGYGGVLYQVSVNAEGKREYEPLTFISRKWSDPATRWDTFSQECFGIFACVKECSHLLRGKPFIIETDHANLRTMEQSQVPKIIRQHLYLRTFTCWVRHVAGKSNTADYWSRLLSVLELNEHTLESLYLASGSEPVRPYNEETERKLLDGLCSSEDQDPDFWNDSGWLGHALCAIGAGRADTDESANPELPGKTQQELFDSVHGGKMLHQGVRRTWLLLNKLYPAHGIPIAQVQSMVDECAVCQKFRLGLRDKLTPMTRVLKPSHHRRTVGVDTLTITPESADGYKAIITIVNHYTHHVFLYPVKKYDSTSLADALMQYISNYGLFDELISDPGSDLTSKAIEELNSWLGVRHVVSLVDVHTSNGCENTNKQIINHLSCLCNDLRIKEKWSDPKVIGLIQLHFNNSISAETGIRPFEALFGSVDEFYYSIPEDQDPKTYMTEYVKRLDEALRQLRSISTKHQQKLVQHRVDANKKHNQFQVGDLVLKSVRTPSKHWKPQKIGPQFYGPYIVERVNSNDYTCRHVTDGTVEVYNTTMLKPYFGTMIMAKRAALLDHDQYFVTKVSHYIGDPYIRTSLEFWITFTDGDEQWQVFSQDLVDNEAFQTYIRSKPELWPLLTSDAVFKKTKTLLNSQPITEVSPGKTRYVDLRVFGAYWYNNYEDLKPMLPNEDTSVYVVPFIMGDWKNAKTKTKIAVHCPLLECSMDWNHESVRSWAAYKELQPGHILVDEQFLKLHPMVAKSLQHRNKKRDVVPEEMTKLVKKLDKRRKTPPVPSSSGKVVVKPVKKPTVKPKGKPVVSVRRSTRLQKGVCFFFLFDLALLLDHCVVSFIVVVVVRKGNRLHYFS